MERYKNIFVYYFLHKWSALNAHLIHRVHFFTFYMGEIQYIYLNEEKYHHKIGNFRIF